MNDEKNSTTTSISTALTQVSLVNLDQLPALRINNAQATALIALQGAQVLEYTPRQQKPVIWLSETAQFRRGENIRGGIPICWPWFGELRRNPAPVRAAVNVAAYNNSAAPAHGLVRSQNWLLESITEQLEYTHIVLRYPTDVLASVWPHAAELTLSIRVGNTLHLQLNTCNRDTQPLSLTQALHTYFSVSDTKNIAIRGFEITRYIDTLDAWREQAQIGTIRIDGEIDRIYQHVPAHIQLHDDGWQRTIHLRTRNSTSAVIWNPHIEKAQRLAQFPADAWQRMLCIESANVLNDMITLAPGAEQSLDVEIWSERLQ